MKKKLRFLLMSACIAAALCASSCGDVPPGGNKPEDPGPGITDPDDPNKPDPDDPDKPDPDDPDDNDKKVSYSITVKDCFDSVISGAKISMDGTEKGVTDDSGKFTVADVKASDSGVISVSYEGYVSREITYGGGNATGGTVSLGDIDLVKNYTVVSSLETVAWEKFEAFTVKCTRDVSALLISAVADNVVFTSEGRDSKLEFYVSKGAVSASRDGNVTLVSVTSDGTVAKKNFGGRDLSSYNVKSSVVAENGKTEIDLSIPYAMLGCAKTNTVGIAAGLYSDTDGERAEMTVPGGGVTAPSDPRTYLRIDKTNKVFVSPKNEQVETPSYDKAELTKGYRMQFSTPELNKVADADDMYLKAEKQDDGFIVSMIGFGDFADNEHVKLIFHTSDTDASGWAIQTSDLSVLVSKTKAAFRTGITKFWSADGGYTVFDPIKETALSSAPEYAENDGWFSLKIKVLFEEIPGYRADGKVSLFAMEFADNGTANGLIYDGKDYRNGMLVDGQSQGDPAAQSSYFIIQEKPESELVKGYGIRFATGADNIYAKVERGVSSLTLHIRGFKALGANDFIRLIVHNGDTADTNAWQIDTKDVSFTVYKDIVYTQTGNVSFFDNESDAFHGHETALHSSPEFKQNDGYWDMTVTVEYIELGAEIYSDTELRALLVKYTGTKLESGTAQNGKPLGDPAFQKNWFVI